VIEWSYCPQCGAALDGAGLCAVCNFHAKQALWAYYLDQVDREDELNNSSLEGEEAAIRRLTDGDAATRLAVEDAVRLAGERVPEGQPGRQSIYRALTAILQVASTSPNELTAAQLRRVLRAVEAVMKRVRRMKRPAAGRMAVYKAVVAEFSAIGFPPVGDEDDDPDDD
jgi:hypothetical protein